MSSEASTPASCLFRRADESTDFLVSSFGVGDELLEEAGEITVLLVLALELSDSLAAFVGAGSVDGDLVGSCEH
jgi:hypothetical protein